MKRQINRLPGTLARDARLSDLRIAHRHRVD